MKITIEELEFPQGIKNKLMKLKDITKLHIDFIKGYCTNECYKELVYVLEGIGKICTKDKTIEFKVGDVLLIDKEEIYYWEGLCKFIMVCSPTWYKEQCKLLEQD